MKLLVTAPLTLEPGQIISGIKLSGFNAGELVATEEFCRAYHKILAQVGGDTYKSTCLSLPLEETEFGDSAAKIRHFELIEKSEAVLILARKSPLGCPLESEPGVKLDSLLSLASKLHMPVKVIEF